LGSRQGTKNPYALLPINEQISQLTIIFSQFMLNLFRLRKIHGIVVLAEAFAQMKRFTNPDLHRQSTPEFRYGFYWANATLHQ
jgi:hypothetical protein